MSTKTRRGSSPHRERDTGGQRQDKRGAVLGRKADRDDCPFPNKPVSHRSSFSSRTQNTLGLFDFENDSHPRRPVVSQGHRGKEDSPSEEVQMAKAIHEKQLKLQEKLWRVEEKIKHKIQSGRNAEAAAAAGNDEMKRRGRGQPDQLDVDVKQLREEKMTSAYGEDGAGGRRGETGGAESSQSRRKWEEKDDVYGDKGVRSQRETEKTKGDAGWTREETYWERTSDDHEDRRQIGRQKSVDRLDTEHKTSRESGEEEELGLTGANFQLFPCRMCNRMFARERLEKHAQICKKVKQSQRQVFNSYTNRTKGSALEEFLKTHSRSKSPEVLQRKNCRQNDQKAKTKTVQQHARLPAAALQSKRSK